MNKSTKILTAVVVFLAVVLVAVGYAAITSVNLKISGSAKAEGQQTNFSVEFTGTPTTGGDGTTTATLSTTDKKAATMNVTGLTAKGEKATATFTVKNTSADLSANLAATATNDNETYFKVTYAIANPTTIAKDGTTTITVTVELLKTPIQETEAELTANIEVLLTATPVQPS